MFVIYTRDLALETARQASVATSEDRLVKMRNRIARSKDRALVLIAIVAKENGDRTVADEARDRLIENGTVEKGAKLADLVEIRTSRRESRARAFVAITTGTPDATDEPVSEPADDPTPVDVTDPEPIVA